MQRYYSYGPIPKPITTPKHHRTLKRIGLFVSLGSMLVVAHSVYIDTTQAKRQAVVAPAAQPTTNVNAVPKSPVVVAPTAPSTVSGAVIQHIIDRQTNDQIGVAVENITTRQLTTYGVTTPFVAASTEKVLSAVTYYHLAEKGVVSLDTQLGDYTAGYQIQQMIQESDNDSWALINDQVGLHELQAYAATIGVTYDVANNELKPTGVATLLSKLYAGDLLTAAHTQELLGYMQNTNDETMIPASVPYDVTVYHKYGELDDTDPFGNVLHDTAILVHGNDAYAVVIYTNGSSDHTTRREIIQQLTQAIVSAYGL